MSYTTMFIVPKKTQLKPFKEYRNSFGSAFAVWSYLWDKYLKTHEHDYMHGTTQYERLWPVWKDSRLLECEKICHTMTFDDAIIKQADLKFVSDKCTEFAHLYAAKNPSAANHWKSIGEDLLLVPKSAYGVCFRWTSVTDQWSVYKAGRSRFYKLSDKKHWIYRPKQFLKPPTQEAP